jgi:radical SAM protein with 4Fe4S-binding SPASM domain
VEICKIADKKNVKYSFTIVMLESNPDISTLKENTQNLYPQKTQYSVIYDISHKKEGENYPTLLNTTLRTHAFVYYHNNWFHPCLWGKIALAVNGDLLPCPYFKTDILGNMKDYACIDRIFENNNLIFKYWEQLPLSNIAHCKDCEFRYGCMDCRALETRLTGSLHGKKICSLGKL